MTSGADSREKFISTTFESLGLCVELLRSLEVQGYLGPTPIQAQAIPVVLAGRDLLAAAQTGTGKTAGFTLPLLHRLRERQRAERAARGEVGHSPGDALHADTDTAEPSADAPASIDGAPSTTSAANPARPKRRPSILIMVPTRELAAQVNACARTYGRFMYCRTVVIFGGVNMEQQVAELQRGADIIVATPGRLLDHAGEKTIDLSGIDTLVLDEADRMLDMGFIHDIRRVLALLPAKRQNLLFSATFSDEIRELANGFLTNPASVEVAPRNKPIELIAQTVHPVDREKRRALLTHLIKSQDWRQVLVFMKTKHGANRLAEQLVQDGIDADAIHGNKSQNARTKALERFRANESRVLVATDIAARGLDIEGLPHVVNYDLPHVPEDYVHRIGRTGRAGSEGEAITLLCGEERELLAGIEKLIKRGIERKVIEGFEPSPEWETARYEPDPRHNGRGQPQRNKPNGNEARGPRPGDSGQKPRPARSNDQRVPRPAQPPTDAPAASNAPPRENPAGNRFNGNGRDGQQRRPGQRNQNGFNPQGQRGPRPPRPNNAPYADQRPGYAVQGYPKESRDDIVDDEKLDQIIDGNRVDYRGNNGNGGNGGNANQGARNRGNANRPYPNRGGGGGGNYNRPYRPAAAPYASDTAGPMQSGRAGGQWDNGRRNGPVAPHESRLHEAVNRPGGGQGKRRSPGVLLTGLPKDEE